MSIEVEEFTVPSSFPGSNDTFTEPSDPSATSLSASGDASRNHTEHHRDLGDAIEAIEQNVALLTHDHSGTGARPTEKLRQSNTHQSPDTDLNATSLHHTLGNGNTQAAPGNHTHSGAAGQGVKIPITSVNNLQAALDTFATTSSLDSRIQGHTHMGGANGPNLSQGAITGLEAALSGKQDNLSTDFASSASLVIDPEHFTIRYFYMKRFGAVAVVSMAIETKWGASGGGSGNVSNRRIGTIRSNSPFSDIYKGISNTQYPGMQYPLSSHADGAMAAGYINSDSKEIILSAITPFEFNPGYLFSLGGMFFLNSGTPNIPLGA